MNRNKLGVYFLILLIFTVLWVNSFLILDNSEPSSVTDSDGYYINLALPNKDVNSVRTGCASSNCEERDFVLEKTITNAPGNFTSVVTKLDDCLSVKNNSIHLLPGQTDHYISYDIMNNKTEYLIPLTYTTSAEMNFENIRPTKMLQENMAIETNSTDEDDFILFNLQRQGFNHLNYNDTLWERIIEHLQKSRSRRKIRPLNRTTFNSWMNNSAIRLGASVSVARKSLVLASDNTNWDVFLLEDVYELKAKNKFNGNKDATAKMILSTLLMLGTLLISL